MLVSIHSNNARQLARDYRQAKTDIDGSIDRLGSLVQQGAELLGTHQPPAVDLFTQVSTGLGAAAEDLEWRIDYIEESDRSFEFNGKLIINGMPSQEPEGTMSADELADAFRQLIGENDRFRQRDMDAILEGLREFVNDDFGSPEWDDIIDYWNEELEDRDLQEDLADAMERLNRTEIAADQLAALIGELEANEGDPWFLADVFEQLGPEATLELTEIVGVVSWRKALAGNGHGPELEHDPQEMSRVLSEALGEASFATEPVGRHGRLGPVLGDDWFDQLLDEGVIEVNGWPFDDYEVLHDGLPALFGDGVFRTEVASDVGVVGMRVMNHEVRVDRGVGSPFYDGFAELGTSWEKRGGDLLAPATKDPEAASNVLNHTYDDGRTGTAIIADGDFDNMNQELVAAIYGPLIVAGTVEAEDLAVTDGVVTDPELLEQAWTAKTDLFEAIEAHRADVEYGPELTMAFATVVADTIPHAMVVSEKSGDGFIVTEGEQVPSDRAGIHLSEEQLTWLLGALFRDEAARFELGVVIAVTQRFGVLEDAGPNAYEGAGELHGAWINGYNVAILENAVDADAEQARINDLIDGGWDGVQVVAGLLPGGGTAIKVVGHVDSVLGAFGEDAVHEQFHLPENNVAEARGVAGREIRETRDEARHFVFDRAFERMQADLVVNGGDPSALAGTSAAIFERVSSHPDIAGFEPGVTTIHDIRTDGERSWDAYLSVTETMIATEPGLEESLRHYWDGLQSAWIGESNE